MKRRNELCSSETRLEKPLKQMRSAQDSVVLQVPLQPGRIFHFAGWASNGNVSQPSNVQDANPHPVPLAACPQASFQSWMATVSPAVSVSLNIHCAEDTGDTASSSSCSSDRASEVEPAAGANRSGDDEIDSISSIQSEGPQEFSFGDRPVVLPDLSESVENWDVIRGLLALAQG